VISLYFELLIIYLAAMNIVGFVSMSLDKRKAKRHTRRISEKTLFLIAVFGGSVGSLLGMYVFHHKTKHLRFVIGLPLILLLQIALAIYLIKIMG
jgi:uncharacterized membrane protein YsdA (DUF1294 family)